MHPYFWTVDTRRLRVRGYLHISFLRRDDSASKQKQLENVNSRHDALFIAAPAIKSWRICSARLLEGPPGRHAADSHTGHTLDGQV